MPIVGRLYNRVSPRAAHRASACSLFAVGAWQMSHFTLDDGHARHRRAARRPGRRLRVPVRAAHHRGARQHPAPPAGGRHRPQLARAPDWRRRSAWPSSPRCSTRYAVHGARPRIAAHMTSTRPEVWQRLHGGRSRASSPRGMDAVSARTAALQRMLGRHVAQQAMVLAFEQAVPARRRCCSCWCCRCSTSCGSPSRRGAADVHGEMHMEM